MSIESLLEFGGAKAFAIPLLLLNKYVQRWNSCNIVYCKVNSGIITMGQCYGLNVCVLSKIHMLKPSAQRDDIKRWGGWEVIRS